MNIIKERLADFHTDIEKFVEIHDEGVGSMPQLLEVKELSKSFTIHHLNKTMEAVENINFSLSRKVNLLASSGRVAVENRPF